MLEKNKQTCMALCGSHEQLFAIRPYTYTAGGAKGLDVLEVKNGPLCFTLMPGKCLDIAEMSYKGINIGYLAKTGLQGPLSISNRWNDADKGHMGGLMFTAGPENIGPACTIDERDYPGHGSFRFESANLLRYDIISREDETVLTAGAQMRYSRSFGENIRLDRMISSVVGTSTLVIQDTITNDGFLPTSMLMLYHCNFGYPLLAPNAKLYMDEIPTPRDQQAEFGLHRWSEYGEAVPGKPEEVFCYESRHQVGMDCATIWNADVQLGVRVQFSVDTLPYLYIWKTEASGDYALGLEPANASILGRRYYEDNAQAMPNLQAGESKQMTIKLDIIDKMP